MSVVLLLALFLFAPALAMAAAGLALLSVRAVRSALRLLVAAVTPGVIGATAR